MSFSLISILWTFALLAAAMAAFGSLGVVFAVGVLLFWAAVFYGTNRTLLDWLVIFGVFLVIVALLLPAFQPGAAQDHPVDSIAVYK